MEIHAMAVDSHFALGNDQRAGELALELIERYPADSRYSSLAAVAATHLFLHHGPEGQRRGLDLLNRLPPEDPGTLLGTVIEAARILLEKPPEGASPAVVSRLAYGRMTKVLHGYFYHGPDIKGYLSVTLRAAARRQCGWYHRFRIWLSTQR
jgi:hypothetical protein